MFTEKNLLLPLNTKLHDHSRAVSRKAAFLFIDVLCESNAGAPGPLTLYVSIFDNFNAINQASASPYSSYLEFQVYRCAEFP